MSAKHGFDLNALKNAFDAFDQEGENAVNLTDVESICVSIGKTREDVAIMLNKGRHILDRKDGKVSFEELVEMIKIVSDEPHGYDPDPKVVEFLKILEDYRDKCQGEGNYLEAERADKQLKTLRKQEEKRRIKSLTAKQLSERQDVQIAHNLQFQEFNNAWDKYLAEYDAMAQVYYAQMQEKHTKELAQFQDELQREILERPPKFSKELLEWRRREQLFARQKNYAEAQRIKKIADALEEKELQDLNDENSQLFARKEAKFRQKQQAEMAALLKRIDARRKEHLKQRSLDSKRLLQRNRNVQAVLESKQMVESQRQTALIKGDLLTKKNSTASAKTSSAGNNAPVMPVDFSNFSLADAKSSMTGKASLSVDFS